MDAQKEVQSAHWHHRQVTLFTAHAWINNDNNFSMVIISDHLNHTKYCILVLCSAFFEAFKQNFQAYKLSIFSAMDQLLSLSRGFFFLICTTGIKITILPSNGTSLPPLRMRGMRYYYGTRISIHIYIYIYIYYN